VAAAALSACASNEPIGRSQVGAAVGAVTGAILGHQIDDDRGRLIGAAVGAIAGAAVGNYMDEQQAALEEQLRQEREAEAIEVTRIANDTLRLNVNSEVSFAVNSALISADFYNSLNKVSGVLKDYAQTVVHVVGHTDSTGPDAYNQRLSEERADNVRRYLVSQNITAGRVVAEGRGERSPIADNRSEAGRSKNRRVEILLKTIVEGREDQAFRLPAS
jgi:outer membrane protein OmpA-like peptidoglycan-associated protein